MKRLIAIVAAISVSAAAVARQDTVESINPVLFSDVHIDDAFWSPRIANNTRNTLPVCIDQIEVQTGRIRNFENAAAHSGSHSGKYYDDSDVYKALEGMAYTLQNHPDSALEAKCDRWIAKFAAAQEPDGYLNTFYSLTGLDKRWTDMNKHEMYCAGHLIEAAVAYFNVTGKRELLDVAERFVEHMMSIFGPGKRHWVPGHEEIELALVKLYKTTGKREYLDFADWLISERGHGHFSPLGKRRNTAYCQDDVPVRQMTDIQGHAVRAMYLYCGMADVAAQTSDKGYIDALERLWDDVVLRNMYITGGIGSSKHNEGFTTDYDLPNLTAYCETCASIGMVLWNWRMNLLTGDSKYADVVERCMYNGVLSGVSLDGRTFFYVNPLESAGDHHRKPWYGTACCPSNVCRFIPSVGNYVYARTDKALWVNMFIGNTAEFDGMKLRMETGYPWDGGVHLTLDDAGGGTCRQIRVRIPTWCDSWTVKVNGKPRHCRLDKGYAVLSRRWRSGDTVDLCLDIRPKAVSADPRVVENSGKRAVVRGPLVYCLEQVDNAESFDTASVAPTAPMTSRFCPELLGGVEIVECGGLMFVPYYAWDNRSPCPMKVWISESR